LFRGLRGLPYLGTAGPTSCGIAWRGGGSPAGLGGTLTVAPGPFRCALSRIVRGWRAAARSACALRAVPWLEQDVGCCSRRGSVGFLVGLAAFSASDCRRHSGRSGRSAPRSVSGVRGLAYLGTVWPTLGESACALRGSSLAGGSRTLAVARGPLRCARCGLSWDGVLLRSGLEGVGGLVGLELLELHGPLEVLGSVRPRSGVRGRRVGGGHGDWRSQVGGWGLAAVALWIGGKAGAVASVVGTEWRLMGRWVGRGRTTLVRSVGRMTSYVVNGGCRWLGGGVLIRAWSLASGGGWCAWAVASVEGGNGCGGWAGWGEGLGQRGGLLGGGRLGGWDMWGLIRGGCGSGWGRSCC
jgi:hypothetical protein